MACTCITDVENKVLDRIKEINPTYTITDSDFENKIIPFSDSMELGETILTHRFGYEYTSPKKDGTPSATRKGSICINPSYCGFCGKKFIEE